MGINVSNSHQSRARKENLSNSVQSKSHLTTLARHPTYTPLVRAPPSLRPICVNKLAAHGQLPIRPTKPIYSMFVAH